MVIHYSGLHVELREIRLRNKPEQMLAASKKGTVPVLILTDGRVIDESIDIVRWGLAANDPSGWLADLSCANLERANQLIELNDFSFKANLDRYKYADRYPQMSPEEYRRKGEVFLAVLNDSLAETTYLLGSTPSIADIAIFPFIRQFAFVDKDWFDQSVYKNLQKWLESWLRSELFNAVMIKYPPWAVGDIPTVFPH